MLLVPHIEREGDSLPSSHCDSGALVVEKCAALERATHTDVLGALGALLADIAEAPGALVEVTESARAHSHFFRTECIAFSVLVSRYRTRMLILVVSVLVVNFSFQLCLVSKVWCLLFLRELARSPCFSRSWCSRCCSATRT